MPETEYALHAEGIDKSFGRTRVLSGASLFGEAGTVTTLLGRNGAGKTTLMRICAGVLRADAGAVTVFGNAGRRHALPRLARLGLMFVPQEQLVAPGYRVRDHVRALADTFGSSGVEEAVAEMRVESMLGQRVALLSGGERMRVSLALALARAPKVLIADEPLVRLSPHNQEELGRALRTLAARGTAVITSGHEARVLFEISDSILWCVGGTTQPLGTPAQAALNEEFQREYLGRGFAD